MNNIKVGLNTALVTGAKEIVSDGKVRVNARTGSEIKELRDWVFIGNPEMRYINIDERKNNLAAQVCEMMMVLSGNPDLKYLSMFLPRAIDYSDDGGKTWRGNYGIRLRGNKAFNGDENKSYQFARYNRDNLKNVINTLKADPSSRQCFVTIGDSNLDRFIQTKDTPCTMTLVFGVTADNLLNMTTLMRSNDIIFGFSGVNYFIFTCLQELVSDCIGIDLGQYCHHSVSFHVYDFKYSTIEKIAAVDEKNIKEVVLEGGLFKGLGSLEAFDKIAAEYFRALETVRTDKDVLSLKEYHDILDSVCSNKNLVALLTMTIAYQLGSERKELYALINDSKLVESGLLDRDSFLAKKLK